MAIAAREVFHYRERKLPLGVGALLTLAIPITWFALLVRLHQLITPLVVFLLMISALAETALVWSVFHSCNGEIAIEGNELVQYDFLGRECVRTPFDEIYSVTAKWSWCPPGSGYVLYTKAGRMTFSKRISSGDELLRRVGAAVQRRGESPDQSV